MRPGVWLERAIFGWMASIRWLDSCLRDRHQEPKSSYCILHVLSPWFCARESIPRTILPFIPLTRGACELILAGCVPVPCIDIRIHSQTHLCLNTVLHRAICRTTQLFSATYEKYVFSNSKSVSRSSPAVAHDFKSVGHYFRFSHSLPKSNLASIFCISYQAPRNTTTWPCPSPLSSFSELSFAVTLTSIFILSPYHHL